MVVVLDGGRCLGEEEEEGAVRSVRMLEIMSEGVLVAMSLWVIFPRHRMIPGVFVPCSSSGSSVCVELFRLYCRPVCNLLFCSKSRRHTQALDHGVAYLKVLNGN